MDWLIASWLLRKQAILKRTDAQMGELLNISEDMYRKIIKGKRRAGRRVLEGVADAFSEDDWLRVRGLLLAQKGTRGPSRDSQHHRIPAEPALVRSESGLGASETSDTTEAENVAESAKTLSGEETA